MSKHGVELPKEKKKPWPADCVWPEPVTEGFGDYWEAEDAEGMPLDETAQELLDIKEYMDELVSEGRLKEDYTLDPDYEDWLHDDEDADDEDADDDGEWEPEQGLDYWNDGFDLELWQEDMSAQLNLLKLPLPSPVDDIRRIIGYEFVNENLLRQAFTRRAFGLEHGLGDSEVLELIGDSVLNTVVTREIARHLTSIEETAPSAPFRSSCSEGELTQLRNHYICKETLASRAAELGLDTFILYGAVEEPSESAREDMLEALIGAVAVDCDWDWHVLEGVVDQLLCLQFDDTRRLLSQSCYDLFNAWHQRKFGRMPEYEVSRGLPVGKGSTEYVYSCTLRYSVPQNDRGIWTSQRADVQAESRSKAREAAAAAAYSFVVKNGLWVNLADAHLNPSLEDSINQLQELYQKKYVEEKPEYSFEERDNLGTGNEWHCICTCGGVEGWGVAEGKTKAKKKAAFMVLVRLMRSAGLSTKEREKAIWED